MNDSKNNEKKETSQVTENNSKKNSGRGHIPGSTAHPINVWDLTLCGKIVKKLFGQK